MLVLQVFHLIFDSFFLIFIHAKEKKKSTVDNFFKNEKKFKKQNFKIINKITNKIQRIAVDKKQPKALYLQGI